MRLILADRIWAENVSLQSDISAAMLTSAQNAQKKERKRYYEKDSHTGSCCIDDH